MRCTHIIGERRVIFCVAFKHIQRRRFAFRLHEYSLRLQETTRDGSASKYLSLSQAKATEQIAGQIGAIQSETGGAVKMMEEIAAITGEVRKYTTAIAGAVEQQSMATQEISSNITLAAAGTGELSQKMEAMSGNVAQTAESARDVGETAKRLECQRSALLQAVDGFMGKVRSM